MSIHSFRPGTGRGAGPHFHPVCCTLAMFLIVTLAAPAPAHGYSLQRIGANGTIRLRADDISQGGTPLGRGTEQVFTQGDFQGELVDFNQPVAVNIPVTQVGGTLTALVDRNQAFVIRLSPAERNQCLTEADFDVAIMTVSPADAFVSSAGGGQLDVLSFLPVYRDRQGGKCPSHLFYGYELLLGLDGAAAAGVYAATVEVRVSQLGGGPVEILQMSAELDMPGLLLLYHPSRIEIDLRATAIVGALGATSSCGADACLELGSRTLSVTSLNTPVPVGVGSAAPVVDTMQTVTLQDAVGARATGCASGNFDTATYAVTNTVGGIQPGSGLIAGLQSAPCTLDLSTGDLQFDLDLDQAATTGASATIQITVTGL